MIFRSSGLPSERRRSPSAALFWPRSSSSRPGSRIQDLVDRSFFRKSYDYKRAILDFNDATRDVLSQAELVELLTGHIQSVLPVERLTLISGAVLSGELRLLYPGQNEAESCVSLLPLFPPGRVHARRESVSTEVGIDFSREETLRARRWEMALPLPFKTTALTGCLFLGKKRSGQRYTAEDVELLQTLVMDLSLNLERFRLQEEVITERAAKEKFDELNRLKTEFVSTVSHELRTPLTSIQGLTELLEGGKVTDGATREEIHHTLAAESARLSRLLRNILDFGKIEQQAKTFDFRQEDLGLIISERGQGLPAAARRRRLHGRLRPASQPGPRGGRPGRHQTGHGQSDR